MTLDRPVASPRSCDAIRSRPRPEWRCGSTCLRRQACWMSAAARAASASRSRSRTRSFVARSWICKPMCEVALRIHPRRRGVADRVGVQAVNMSSAAGRGYDALLFSNIFHDWGPETNAKLARRRSTALPSGGRIFLHEMLLDDTGSGPLHHGCVLHADAREYARPSVHLPAAQAMLEGAGFTDMRCAAHVQLLLRGERDEALNTRWPRRFHPRVLFLDITSCRRSSSSPSWPFRSGSRKRAPRRCCATTSGKSRISRPACVDGDLHAQLVDPANYNAGSLRPRAEAAGHAFTPPIPRCFTSTWWSAMAARIACSTPRRRRDLHVGRPRPARIRLHGALPDPHRSTRATG